MATYLITGASRGIGLELTKQLIQLPASQVGKVFTVSRSEAPPALQELLTNNPDRVVHILASINDTASVQKAAQDVKAKLDGSGLDVLVNNAGIQQFAGSAKDMKPEEMAHEFDINCVGPHRMIRAFLPLLEAGKQKKVINMYVCPKPNRLLSCVKRQLADYIDSSSSSSALASITWTARFSFAPTPSYKISKAALHMLISQYANQYSESGFTFLCVSPGVSELAYQVAFISCCDGRSIQHGGG